jgi:uncharacterized protein (TIGR03435 family)
MPAFHKFSFVLVAAMLGVIVLNVSGARHPVAASPRSQEARLAFDVVSIKRSVSKGPGGLTQTQPGRFVATNATLKMLFRPAYGVREYQMSGGPSWIANDRYDIQATTGFTAGSDEIRRMLQALLAAQFSVQLHHEPKEMPVYALVLGRSGVKLKELPQNGDANTPKGGMSNGMTMPGLAEYLSRLPSIDRPVLDRTKLPGRYDVSPLASAASAKATASADSIFTIVQDAGLRLESERGIIDVLVIDHAEKPPENLLLAIHFQPKLRRQPKRK